MTVKTLCKRADELKVGDVYALNRVEVRIVVGDPYTFMGHRVIPGQNYETRSGYGLANFLPETMIRTFSEASDAS